MKKKIIPFILAIVTLPISQYASAKDESLVNLCREVRGSVHPDFKITSYFHYRNKVDGKISAYISNAEDATYGLPSIKEVNKPTDTTSVAGLLAAKNTERLNRQIQLMHETAKMALANESTIAICINTTSGLPYDEPYPVQIIQVSHD